MQASEGTTGNTRWVAGEVHLGAAQKNVPGAEDHASVTAPELYHGRRMSKLNSLAQMSGPLASIARGALATLTFIPMKALNLTARLKIVNPGLVMRDITYMRYERTTRAIQTSINYLNTANLPNGEVRAEISTIVKSLEKKFTTALNETKQAITMAKLMLAYKTGEASSDATKLINVELIEHKEVRDKLIGMLKQLGTAKRLINTNVDTKMIIANLEKLNDTLEEKYSLQRTHGIGGNNLH